MLPNRDSGDNWDQLWADYASAIELNPAQKLRRRLIISWMKRFAGSELKILDIGSGQGDMIADLQRELPRAKLLGVDLSSVGVEIASRKAPNARFLVRNLLYPGEIPPEWRQWANAAVCSEVLEHVDEPDRLLRGAADYLAPGGYLFVTVPGGPISAFDRHIGHRRHFTPRLLEEVIVRAGFDPVRVVGAGFPFFNAYRLIVIAKGEALIERARLGAARLSLIERTAAFVFDLAFRGNLNYTSWGWQIAAIARKKTSA